MKVYISGPMSDHTWLNFPMFFAAAKHLQSLGYEVANPAMLAVELRWRLAPAVPSYEAYLGNSIMRLESCTAFCQLPGWQSSRGANLEYYMAVGMGLHFIPLPDNLTPDPETYDEAMEHRRRLIVNRLQQAQGAAV